MVAAERPSVEPFKTNTGWHIIKILQFHEQPMPENEQGRAKLRGRLEAAIAEQRTAKWMVERFEQGNLQIEDPVLAGVDSMREARFEEAKTHLESTCQTARASTVCPYYPLSDRSCSSWMTMIARRRSTRR